MKNEKGIALPLVLLIIVVLSVLGVSIMHINTADTLQVNMDKERVQAYYLARSGADATAAAIIQDQNNVANINIGANSTLPSVNLGSGNFTVEVGKYDNRLDLKSTGTVNNVSHKVTLNMPKANASDIFDNVIFSYNNLYLNNTTILSGNLATQGNTIQTNDLTFHGNKLTDCPRSYPPPTFPSLNAKGSYVGTDLAHTISKDDEGEYTSITTDPTTNPEGTIIFDTSTATNHVLNIIANSINVKNIKTTGTGTVLLFIKKGASDPQIQIPSSTTANIVVLLEDDVNLNFQASKVYFNGYIYGPNANISISNKAYFTGAFIINEITWDHSGTLAYQMPPSSMDLGSAVNVYKRGSWN